MDGSEHDGTGHQVGARHLRITHAVSGADAGYLNYLEDDVFNAAAVVYGENLPRLRAIKT